ncbi:MAG TPA: hypothetical protein DEB52_02185 [Hyphomonas sp.]|jgi:hypothetical protein|nr:hypothetical protein [Hyphomonas sp.]
MTIVAMKIEKEPNGYWNGTGRFEDLAKWLDKMVPTRGECEKHHGRLERYRKMCNAYYDLFCNGGGNACRGTARYFGGIVKRYAELGLWDECYKITEPKMDKAILDAALDTKLITREEWRLKKEEIE